MHPSEPFISFGSSLKSCSLGERTTCTRFGAAHCRWCMFSWQERSWCVKLGGLIHYTGKMQQISMHVYVFLLGVILQLTLYLGAKHHWEMDQNKLKLSSSSRIKGQLCLVLALIELLKQHLASAPPPPRSIITIIITTIILEPNRLDVMDGLGLDLRHWWWLVEGSVRIWEDQPQGSESPHRLLSPFGVCVCGYMRKETPLQPPLSTVQPQEDSHTDSLIQSLSPSQPN